MYYMSYDSCQLFCMLVLYLFGSLVSAHIISLIHDFPFSNIRRYALKMHVSALSFFIETRAMIVLHLEDAFV